jgi:Spy/CpxP family protein refolding chaperone
MKKLIQSLVLAGVMASAGGVALAQMNGPMMGHGGMMGHGDPARMAQMHARHLADLKAKLKITASQEAAWTTFTEAMQPPADMMAKRPDRAELDKLPTPERIDKMRALHKEHMVAMEAAMDKRAEATKTLYNALSPEQKKTFDAEHARMDQRAGGEHRMHRGGPAAKPAQPAKQ